MTLARDQRLQLGCVCQRSTLVGVVVREDQAASLIEVLWLTGAAGVTHLYTSAASSWESYERLVDGKTSPPASGDAS